MDYAIDGRTAAMKVIRDWLIERVPETPDDKKDPRYARGSLRKKLLDKTVKKFLNKAKISLEWREDLSKRLNITPDDIVLATNTIIDMIEKEISGGGRVVLAGFGDVILADHVYKGEKRKIIRFNADETWKRELNAPLFAKELGLKHTLGTKKLTRTV